MPRVIRSGSVASVAAMSLVFALGCGDSGDPVDAGRPDADPVEDAGEDGGAAEPWQLVFEDLDGALISVAGTSAKDVWAVGADTRDGKGALVLHYDGAKWRREATGVEVDLWWVHVFSARAALMGGAEGVIVRWDGERFERMDTPGTSTVFGIWGAAEDDVWAVGGEPDVTPGFVWHFDGNAWDDRTQALPVAAQGPPLFKAWGRSAADVWIVGVEGVAVHWNGTQFELGESGTERMLFTVHGVTKGDPAFVAVGGFGDAVITEHDGSGTTWHTTTPDPAPPQMFGVFMVGENDGYAVGLDGAVMRRDAKAWKLLDTGIELFNPFHSVWVDPDRGVWAVGGDVLSPTPSEGMLLHLGEQIPDAISE